MDSGKILLLAVAAAGVGYLLIKGSGGGGGNPKITLNPAKPAVGEYFDMILSGFPANTTVQGQTSGFDANGNSIGSDTWAVPINSQGSYTLSLNRAPQAGTYHFAAYINGETVANLTIVIGGVIQGYGDIVFVIKDSVTGNYVFQASVVIPGHTVMTNTSGEAAFYGLPVGNLDFHVAKTGYVTLYSTLTVLADTTGQANINLIPA